MNKIGVLTYPIKHRKTIDVLALLKANGYKDVRVYAIPFHYKKSVFPIYNHRPEMNYCIPEISLVCKNYGYEYYEGQVDSLQIEENRIVLIAGAGILDDCFIKKHIIINAHPGYIPNCRGLDSFKWAIIEDQPIGVTSHLIGEYVDAGKIIERRQIPVYSSDTFHAVSQRVYENEVSMLVEAIEKYDSISMEVVPPDDSVVHRRMPRDIEMGLMESFEKYKIKHGEAQ